MMKVMVIVKASSGSEAGKMPSEALMVAMGKYNEELVKAGIMESGDGLKPSKEGYRIRFDGKERAVTKGPFIETNELLAGYWVWNVESMEQAIEWAKKCPNPMEDEVSDLEIRPFYALEDFAEVDGTGEFAKQENALRNEIALKRSTLNNYLFFAGRCEEAFEYYQAHLGAKITLLMRFSDSPEPTPEGMLPAGFDNKVMHAELTLADTRIFGSDGCAEADSAASGKSKPGFSLALTVPTKDDAHRMFDALADGGNIDMPLAETFWSPLYGQVTDKFGIAWMIMLPEQKTQ